MDALFETNTGDRCAVDGCVRIRRTMPGDGVGVLLDVYHKCQSHGCGPLIAKVVHNTAENTYEARSVEMLVTRGEASTTRNGTPEQVKEHREAIRATLDEMPAVVTELMGLGCCAEVDGKRCGGRLHLKKPSLPADESKVGENGKSTVFSVSRLCAKQVNRKTNADFPHPELVGKKVVRTKIRYYPESKEWIAT